MQPADGDGNAGDEEGERRQAVEGAVIVEAQDRGEDHVHGARRDADEKDE